MKGGLHRKRGGELAWIFSLQSFADVIAELWGPVFLRGALYMAALYLDHGGSVFSLAVVPQREVFSFVLRGLFRTIFVQKFRNLMPRASRPDPPRPQPVGQARTPRLLR